MNQSDKLVCSHPEMQQEKELWLVDELTILGEAFGESGEKISPERLRMYAAALVDLDREVLAVVFRRALRELKFFPKIAELRELAGANERQNRDAEARAAWDALMLYVNRHVWADPHGHYHADHEERLDQRIRDCVRRTGGWRTYKCTTNSDFPFVHKRFLEEFAAWTEVQRVDLDKLFKPASRLRLVSPGATLLGPKGDSANSRQPSDDKPKSHVFVQVVKPIREALSDAQIRDRREMLREQSEQMKNRLAKGSV